MAYIRHIPEASQAVRRVALADKLHNVRCILTDFRAIGNKVFERFNADKRSELDYYRSLVSAFRASDGNGLLLQLDRAVSDLELAVRSDTP